jgi:hypothetical protein
VSPIIGLVPVEDPLVRVMITPEPCRMSPRESALGGERARDAAADASARAVDHDVLALQK